MKAWTASLLLTIALAPPVSAAPGYGLVCGRGPLDPDCGFAAPPRDARPEWAPLPRGTYGAYEIRFGGSPGRNSPSWHLRAANFARQALFWAAVASVLL
jgi:hypothetical protein